MELTEAENYYANIGFAGRVGFGHSRLLIIDCNYGCASPAVSPIGIAMDEEIRHIRRLLDLARRKARRPHYRGMQRKALRDGGWFVKKVPALGPCVTPRRCKLSPNWLPSPELVLEKRFPSGFTAPTCTPI